MLIEDISLTILGLEGDLGPAKVVQASWKYQINALSNGDFVIEVPKDRSIHYQKVFEYKREDTVGSLIAIRWDTNQGQQPLLFQGIITGISLVKSKDNVQYAIKAAGGPTALYNTSLSAKGWWPYSSFDNSSMAAKFRNQVIETQGGQGWQTPTELMRTLVTVIPPAQLFNPSIFSHAAKNQIVQVAAELGADIANIVEAPIIGQFFGNVGSFGTYGSAIKKRIQDMLTFEHSDSTYWEFFIALCREVGVSVVPFISKTFVVPNMLFTDPPQCNVVFPSLIRSTNLVSEPLDFPDQIIMSAQTNLSQDLAKVYRDLYENTAVVYPETPQDNFSPYAGNRFMVVPPSEYKYLEFIMYQQLKKASDIQKSKQADETKEDINTSSVDPMVRGLLEEYKKYCSNFAEYYYTKLRAEKDYGQVVTAFQPFVVPGFGSYVIDGQEGMNYRGVLTAASHDLSPNGATTVLSFSYLVGIDEELSFNSPLWQQLIPSGANTSDILSQEPSLALNNRIAHVPFTESLLTQREMEDPELAAVYTGRRRKRQVSDG